MAALIISSSPTCHQASAKDVSAAEASVIKRKNWRRGSPLHQSHKALQIKDIYTAHNGYTMDYTMAIIFGFCMRQNGNRTPLPDTI